MDFHFEVKHFQKWVGLLFCMILNCLYLIIVESKNTITHGGYRISAIFRFESYQKATEYILLTLGIEAKMFMLMQYLSIDN